VVLKVCDMLGLDGEKIVKNARRIEAASMGVVVVTKEYPNGEIDVVVDGVVCSPEMFVQDHLYGKRHRLTRIRDGE
jgi:hypothetical protein